jgi:2-polyprenyl-3-methyl-5-hydroxy-6-metoxy-1,4-benzoquinol methylase
MKFADQVRHKIGLRPATLYPVGGWSRCLKSESAPRCGGLEVFDAPEALRLNEARMSHLEWLGLPLAGKRVLDAGCGVGHLASRLERMGCNVVCVDGREEKS